MPRAIAAILAMLAVHCAAPAYARQRTDVVTLGNGDRITGEIMRLERGRLEFKTDDAGTLYLEWDKLVSLVAARLFEVETSAGDRYLGTLGAASARSIAVVTPGGVVPLVMVDVTSIAPIGRSFWSKLDGSVDIGFTYTRSSGVAQLNINSSTVHRRPGSQFKLALSVTQTRKDDDSDRDDRGTLEGSYLVYPWQKWFFLGAGRFETNESLGLELRSQAAVAVGPRLVNSNRAQLAVGGGLVVNDERGVNVDSTRNVEGLLVFGWSFYTYDRPKTNIDINLQYYPSLSNPGRHRAQFDAAVKRELWKDFFASLSGYNTYDNRPPNPAADTNDVGVVLSIGWSY